MSSQKGCRTCIHCSKPGFESCVGCQKHSWLFDTAAWEASLAIFSVVEHLFLGQARDSITIQEFTLGIEGGSGVRA